jgi:hypothetical protein
MFIQTMEGTTSRPDDVKDQVDTWVRDLMPGAIGYLGSTSGCTDDGHCIVIARFASADDARRNSERPEQDAWWRATAELFDGPVAFHESEEVQVKTHGDVGGAKFVQIMEGHVTDRERAKRLEDLAEPVLVEQRPDILGFETAYFDDDRFVEAVYFSSEDAARAGEQQAMPEAFASSFEEMQQVMQVEQYIDLREPWLTPTGPARPR